MKGWLRAVLLLATMALGLEVSYQVGGGQRDCIGESMGSS